ncbi:HNH endonuclease domain-containing protein [Photobacterium kagoshimensis]|uniref:HNH endonuclease domain-containing protein n=1 Tax=Photobacterium kagoshimensis TaxID=2910242 RepID=UPI003D0A1DB9
MLPVDPQLNINALARLFDITTTSYKPLFFKALLEIVKERGFNSTQRIAVRALCERMLFLSLYPNYYFKLSFGPQDMMRHHLKSIGLDKFNTSRVNNKTLVAAKLLIANNFDQSSAVDLQKYVPFRLLQPFFSKELKGKADHHKNSLTFKLAGQEFDQSKPIYRFIENTSKDVELEIHPLWLKYFESNYQIVESWAELNWIQFLQRRNPNTPAITNKTAPPVRRECLTKQRKFWNEYIQHIGLKCIFTNTPINLNDYELDHFVPWSFVGHDQQWNLIPINPTTNSSKSNNLPAKQYLKHFIKIQKSAVQFAISTNKKSVIEDHLIGLQCTEIELSTYSSQLEHRFYKTIESLIDMAGLQGFECGWEAS